MSIHASMLAMVWALACCASAEPAKIIKEFNGVSGALFARSIDEAPVMLIFSGIVQAESVVGEHKPDPNKVFRIPSPADLPKGVGENLTPAGKIALARMVLGGGFAGLGPSRKVRVLRIDNGRFKQMSTGLSWAFIDWSSPVSVDGSLPDALPPCEAAVQLARGGRTEFFLSVPELWPKELSKNKIAFVPRFVRLSTSNSSTWGQGKDFLVYETIDGNPFTLRIGKSIRIVNIVEMEKGRVSVITSCGEVAHYDSVSGTWSKPCRLVQGTVISVLPCEGSYLVFWKDKYARLMSANTIDMERITEIKHENLPLSAIADMTIVSDGVEVCAVGIAGGTKRSATKDTGQSQSVLFSRKDRASSKWGSWVKLSSYPYDAQLVIDASRGISDRIGVVYVAVTDRKVKRAKVYFLPKPDQPVRSSLIKTHSQGETYSRE